MKFSRPASTQTQPPKPVDLPLAHSPASQPSQEFFWFDCGKGFHWLFPRAHLVAAKSLSNGRCEMNFRTHLVTFVSGAGPALITELMEGKVCKLIGPRGGEQEAWARVVEDLKVVTLKTAETAGAIQGNREAIQ